MSSTSTISSASAALTGVVAGDKSNDWLMQWYGNDLCLVLALALSLALVLALTDDVVTVGKSNDWLMWWYGNAVCLALALSLVLVLALTDVVAGGKPND